MADENIELFRGTLPKCLNCGERLRAQYKTEKELIFHGTGKKKVWLPRPGCETTEFYPPPADPTIDGQEDTDHVGKIYWSKRSQKWYRVATYEKVKSRKFTGKFGSRSDNFFCQTECGYRWAVRQAKANYGERAPT
jgi:hypothetical protein